jgi:hypothetical protein
MDEQTFCDAIDSAFPLDNRERALRLANSACDISSNAAFFVVDQVARPPAGAPARFDIQLKVLEEIRGRLNHPLAEVVLPIAEALVTGDRITVEQAERALREVGEWPGEHAALGLVYFAADDVDGTLAQRYNRVRAQWEALQTPAD